MNKVLVVEDHADFRQLIALCLEGEYEVVQASNGTEALQLARCEKPFAVLLDIVIPGKLDGIDVLNAIRADPQLRDMTVAMVTARGQASDRALSERMGADGYFIKPFSPRQLLSWLRQHAPGTAMTQLVA